MTSLRKIGILGGTFNPVHSGHLHLAQLCFDELCLDKILVIPTNIPPHKSADNIVENHHRVNMLKLAFEGFNNVEISDIELKKQGKSYTIDTLLTLKEKYPNNELFLIVGGDMFLCFEKWKDYKKILSLCTVCTAPREDNEYNSLIAYQNILDPQHNKTIIFNSNVLSVSSSEIRNNIDCALIPSKVKEYIIQEGLYNNGWI